MNKHLVLLFSLLILTSIPLHAQDMPFIFTLHGGLFFPSKSDFNSIYQSHSDLIWSVGASAPLGGGMFIVGDYGSFRSRGFFDATLDSTAKYEERIIHLGILNKQSISKSVLLRLMGGLNRVKVKQTAASPRSQEQSIETGDNNGFFGGIGIEEILAEPHVSFFFDAVYDYSRSSDRTFSGDFGGVRLVLGVNFILSDR